MSNITTSLPSRQADWLAVRAARRAGRRGDLQRRAVIPHLVLDDALVAVESAADPTAADNGPAQAAGMLHLASAQLSSRERRSGDADTHLMQAAELADATGECNNLNYHFGSANVAAWSVSIGVELERGPDAAEQVMTDLPRLVAALASADRRSGLHLDIARGWAQAGGDRDAEAIRYCPRGRPLGCAGLHQRGAPA